MRMPPGMSSELSRTIRGFCEGEEGSPSLPLPPSQLIDGEEEGPVPPMMQRDGKTYTYRDFSNVPPNPDDALLSHLVNNTQNKSIQTQRFPVKLYAILARKEFSDIVTWMPHGRSWKVLQPDLFESVVMPQFFEYSNYHSFNRLINAWSFRRISKGVDRGSYYHELFLRGLPHLQKHMRRLPKTHRKLPMKKHDEPDFYTMSKTHPLPEIDSTPDVFTANPTATPQPGNGASMPNMVGGGHHQAAAALQQLNGMTALRAVGMAAGMPGVASQGGAMSGLGAGPASGGSQSVTAAQGTGSTAAAPGAPLNVLSSMGQGAANFSQLPSSATNRAPGSANTDLASSLFSLAGMGTTGLSGQHHHHPLLGMQQGLRQDLLQDAARGGAAAAMAAAAGAGAGFPAIGSLYGLPQAAAAAAAVGAPSPGATLTQAGSQGASVTANVLPSQFFQNNFTANTGALQGMNTGQSAQAQSVAMGQNMDVNGTGFRST